MAVTNPTLADISADTLLSESKQDIIDNFADLLQNDVDLEAIVAVKAPIANPIFTGTVKSPKVVLTPEGGIAVKLTNKTGSPSVKGDCVTTSSGTDNAFMLQADEFSAIGFVYETGVADGSECLVVVSGIAEVLLKDTTASTRGHWVYNSATDGRVETKAAPLNDAEHFKEVGHCLESKIAGTNVLAKCLIHFN